METVPCFTLELRHNDEVLGCLTATGAVEALHEEVLHAEARFWVGLKCLRRPPRVVRPRYRLAAHA